jgi:hypothetical protein
LELALLTLLCPPVKKPLCGVAVAGTVVAVAGTAVAVGGTAVSVGAALVAVADALAVTVALGVVPAALAVCVVVVVASRAAAPARLAEGAAAVVASPPVDVAVLVAAAVLVAVGIAVGTVRVGCVVATAVVCVARTGGNTSQLMAPKLSTVAAVVPCFSRWSRRSAAALSGCDPARAFGFARGGLG